MTVEDLNALYGVGEVNARAFYEWFADDENVDMLKRMEDAGVVALQPEGSTAPQVFAGKTFVLTGTLPALSREEARAMIKEKIIQEGMIPKIEACISALEGGVKKTHIINARTPHALLLEIFTDKGIGTEIVK